MWIDITEDLTEKGRDELPVGKVLMFKLEDTETHLKIMRKYKGKVWAKQVYLYKTDEVDIVDKSKHDDTVIKAFKKSKS